MDLSGSLSVNAVLGRSVAVAVLCCGDCGLDLVVSHRGGGLWISRCFDCTERVRTESPESSSGDSCPHGYAAGVLDFSDRLSYLAENSKTGSWRQRDRFLIFGLLTAAMLIKVQIVYAF